MARPSSLSRAQPAIERHLSERSQRVFRRTDFDRLLKEKRDDWKLAKQINSATLITTLLATTRLREVVLTSADYPSVTRYMWGTASSFEVALSIKPHAYLCHLSAAFLHNLTDQIPSTIYVNAEQSPKPEPEGQLTQDALTRAFARPQRTSRLIYAYDNARIVVLAGKNTGRLEVGEVQGTGDETLEVTKLERTLIDLVVRPTYAGGLPTVIDAYRAAKDRVSINTLRATLKKLRYVYPYHQAIGFVMERAGFAKESCDMLFALGTPFDFYLTHAMVETDYDPKWRLFFPKGL